jgi:hypothetical protein
MTNVEAVILIHLAKHDVHEPSAPLRSRDAGKDGSPAVMPLFKRLYKSPAAARINAQSRQKHHFLYHIHSSLIV